MSEITASTKAKDKSAGAKSEKSVQGIDPSFNMDELRDLAKLVDDHGFTDFEFENENIRVRLSKTPPAQIVPASQPVAASVAQVPIAAAVSTEPAPVVEEDLFKITSPIVGTFYRSAGPDKEPYVKEGSQVTNDSVVCIVEAMKLMNEIQAEVSGEVVKVYVENGQPVEYGQPLFGIRK